ncbi:hypothetical protein Fmac_010826 [Flemingia macrophylla]|uniref:Carrier domain-containing protein n=1 Tax=Flemingia macrophylla TaxID=520843 RepID=A0ABD1MMS6_9FABA
MEHANGRRGKWKKHQRRAKQSSRGKKMGERKWREKRRKRGENTSAKQISIDETTMTPQTKFSDLGADSLDTVEIMLTLEEKFEISIGER